MPQHQVESFEPVWCENLKDHTEWRAPDPTLFSNIARFWEILDLVLEDWKREVVPRQNEIDTAASESEKQYRSIMAFNSIQTHYLKCVFSYATFFTVLERAYDLLHSRISRLNKTPVFRCKKIKRPKPTTYVRKVRTIRNLSLAHIGSEKRKGPATAAAAMTWIPVLSKKADAPWNLDNIVYGGFKHTLVDRDGNVIGESDDIKIESILELDAQCRPYLLEWDAVCSTFLRAMYANLPITVGDERYFLAPRHAEKAFDSSNRENE